jgi:hypothetical protein
MYFLEKNSMRRRWVLLFAFLLILSMPRPSLATGGSRTWVQDFEMSTAGWYNQPPGTIHRVPSGYTNGGGYADGILSAHGNWHARLRTAGCYIATVPPVTIPPTAPTDCFGPFTRWGKAVSANPNFPKGGYMTEVDVYLDVQWAAGKTDFRFDWSSAINENTGNHQRDFVFNVGTPLTLAEATGMPGFYVNASTNATRSGAFPQNTCPNPGGAAPNSPNYCRKPVKITQSGWYTFRHSFYPRHHMGTDYLAVDFTVLRHDGVVMANWFISVTDVDYAPDPDRMSVIGGDRYGWFVINEINDLAIDCSNIRPRAIEHPGLREPCLAVSDQDDRDHSDDDEDDDDDRHEHHDRHWDDDDDDD